MGFDLGVLGKGIYGLGEDIGAMEEARKKRKQAIADIESEREYNKPYKDAQLETITLGNEEAKRLNEIRKNYSEQMAGNDYSTLQNLNLGQAKDSLNLLESLPKEPEIDMSKLADMNKFMPFSAKPKSEADILEEKLRLQDPNTASQQLPQQENIPMQYPNVMGDTTGIGKAYGKNADELEALLNKNPNIEEETTQARNNLQGMDLNALKDYKPMSEQDRKEQVIDKFGGNTGIPYIDKIHEKFQNDKKLKADTENLSRIYDENKEFANSDYGIGFKNALRDKNPVLANDYYKNYLNNNNKKEDNPYSDAYNRTKGSEDARSELLLKDLPEQSENIAIAIHTGVIGADDKSIDAQIPTGFQGGKMKAKFKDAIRTKLNNLNNGRWNQKGDADATMAFNSAVNVKARNYTSTFKTQGENTLEEVKKLRETGSLPESKFAIINMFKNKIMDQINDTDLKEYATRLQVASKEFTPSLTGSISESDQRDKAIKEFLGGKGMSVDSQLRALTTIIDLETQRLFNQVKIGKIYGQKWLHDNYNGKYDAPYINWLKQTGGIDYQNRINYGLDNNQKIIKTEEDGLSNNKALSTEEYIAKRQAEKNEVK